MITAGNVLLIWGGTLASGDDFRELSDGGLLDLGTGHWAPLSMDGAPPAVSSRGFFPSFECFWTGREVLFIDPGGGQSDRPPAATPAWGFDPERGTWRKIVG